MLKFSAPMPFDKGLIDRLSRINDSVQKSKITSLYFALPNNCSDVTTFEQSRVFYQFDTDFNYWKPLIQYSLSQGYDFIYLLNSPQSFLVTELDKLDRNLVKLHNLLLNLMDIGVDKVRVANTQLINYISNRYPHFKIYASTSLEYTQMKQYRNFMQTFPNVVEIVPSFELNKNFLLLKNLKQAYPNLEIEIMVNEGCLAGCPFRHHHNYATAVSSKSNVQLPEDLMPSVFNKMCGNVHYSNFFEHICKANVIYPWELEEYEKIGIVNFKLVGRNNQEFNTGRYLDFYETYLRGVDNPLNIDYDDFKVLSNYTALGNLDLKVYEVKPLLPDIKHFVKNGHMCASSCGVTCNYCYKCAEKLNERFNIHAHM